MNKQHNTKQNTKFFLSSTWHSWAYDRLGSEKWNTVETCEVVRGIQNKNERLVLKLSKLTIIMAENKGVVSFNFIGK